MPCATPRDSPRRLPGSTHADAASFPDYDFVSVSPGAFKKASTTRDVVAWVNQHLAEVSVDAGLIDRLWGTLGTQMPMGEVEVYSHPTDWDDPAVSAGSIWSFGFFVVHSASRRIIYLSCTAGSRLARTPVGYRDSSSRLDDRASPSASPPSAVSGAMAFAAAPPSSSSSVATAVYAGALGAPPQVAAGGPSVSAPPFAVLAPTGRSGSRATSSTSSGTAATAPDDPFSAATALGLSNSGAYTPGASHGAFSRGFPAGSTPTAAALLFPERRNLRQGGSGSRLAPAGSDEGEEDLREGLERQRSAFADDDDDDDGMSGDGDGPRAMADEGDDVDDDDRYGRGSSLKASQDGMFDWEDVDS